MASIKRNDSILTSAILFFGLLLLCDVMQVFFIRKSSALRSSSNGTLALMKLNDETKWQLLSFRGGEGKGVRACHIIALN